MGRFQCVMEEGHGPFGLGHELEHIFGGLGPYTPTLKEEPKVTGFQEQAKRAVFGYVKSRLEKTDRHVTFAEDEVYVVWFSKTLQNWKALISTSLPDGMYYEVTYNGDMDEVYLDAYKKFDNVTIASVP